MTTQISIIDDYDSLLTSLSLQFQSQGYSTITFACPQEALEHHAKYPADAYIIDMKMPKMTGFEFYERLCQKLNRNRVPALFLTAVHELEVQALKNTTIGDYILKPFNLNGPQEKEGEKIVNALFRILVEKDASLIEINPLIINKENKIICLDAKMNFDDNAMFRRPEILELRDFSEEDSTEVEASKSDLAYIKLNGSIGCMVNGAGLAMATMDIIKLYGKEPANFLDVGGGASKEQVSAAFKLILSDKNVKGILINIFGGIMRCDVLAQGVIDAAKEINLNIPLVVRLAGTNFKEGKAVLDQSGLKILSATDLNDAAKNIVKAIK